MSAGAARERQHTGTGETGIAIGGKGREAAMWDRVRRRLRAELGEDVFIFMVRARRS